MDDDWHARRKEWKDRKKAYDRARFEAKAATEGRVLRAKPGRPAEFKPTPEIRAQISASLKAQYAKKAKPERITEDDGEKNLETVDGVVLESTSRKRAEAGHDEVEAVQVDISVIPISGPTAIDRITDIDREATGAVEPERPTVTDEPRRLPKRRMFVG